MYTICKMMQFSCSVVLLLQVMILYSAPWAAYADGTSTIDAEDAEEHTGWAVWWLSRKGRPDAGDFADHQMDSGLIVTESCVSDTVEKLDKIVKQYQANKSIEDLRRGVEGFCRVPLYSSTVSSTYMKECMGDLVTMIFPLYYSEQQMKVAFLVKNVTTMLLDYSCLNDGQHLIDFIVEDGVNCVNKSFAKLLEFGRTTVNYTDPADRNDRMVLFGRALQTALECKNIRKLDTFISHQLTNDGCPNVAKISTGLLNYLAHDTNCSPLQPKVKQH